MTRTFPVFRLLSCALVLAAVAGCDDEDDVGYRRPANVPPDSQMLQQTSRANELDEIAGSAHGVAFTTRARELHVLRSGRHIVTKDAPLTTCPSTGGHASGRPYVLADRVVMFDAGCGLWAFMDGDATPRVIASIQKVPHRVGPPEEGRGLDIDLEQWTWAGGAGMRSWLGPSLAFHGASVFLCIAPVPKSPDTLPNAEIWTADIDGQRAPVRVAKLETALCKTLLVDDDAIYVEDALPRTSYEAAMHLDRIDRKTGAVSQAARFPQARAYVRDVALTATHLYLLESGVGVHRVHRVPKSGGAVEPVAGEHRYVAGLRSDGQSVFLAANDGAANDAILRIDGVTEKEMLKSANVSHYRFAAGGGQLVWDEPGVIGDDTDDAIFSMPSR